MVDGVHPLDLGTVLGLKGITIRTGHLCAQPTLRKFGVKALSRISFGIYNTLEEIDLCIEGIRSAIKMLQRVEVAGKC